MELELSLDPDDAARFLRLPLLASATRSRAQPQRIVWHDSADAALTAHGLALAQERGVWRLEKLAPDPAETWPPGAPPPVLAESAEQADLGYDLPAPLAPAVAFAGRRQSLVVETEHGPVTLVLTRGTLRAVTAEHAIARLHAAGDDRAVLPLVLALAAALPLEVACVSLAGTALAAARATPPAVRRHGAPEVPDGMAVVDAFAFVLAHLTDVVLQFAPSAAADVSGPEPVHQMRVALRRLRSALTVFRPVLDCDELQAAGAGLKALSARLGPTRDWDVFLSETLADVRKTFAEEPRLRRLIAAAERQRQQAHLALREFLSGPEFRRLAIELAWLAAARCWHPVAGDDGAAPVPLPDFAAEVLDRRLRKLVGTGDVAALATTELHALRLKAKRTRYAAEVFAPLFPGKVARRFIERLANVQDGLGDLNDATTAARLLAELGGAGGRHGHATGLVLGFVGARASDLRPKMLRRWAKFRRTRAFWS